MSPTALPGSASVHEASGRRGALPSRIKPVAPGMRLHGPAYPLRCPAGDNLWLHRAVAEAPEGAVLVAAVVGDGEYGYWGEVLSHAASARGLAGLVIDGGVRDVEALAAVGFPVFSRGICIQGTRKEPSGDGALAAPVWIGRTVVSVGDLVIGDADGVVVVSAATASDVLAEARLREKEEATIIARLAAGETTLDIYGLPPG
ncbi:4-carboxy-4-hydroxy-2-oxoadipate aldolase/oxaloacetate decarboxylase [Streptomyces sp. NPDC006872]|uniref:4-carboxy-4-hydroxy-2-oxoadipate aldolase/oxaloacetate decarboxylase n=1 Tax=Streptomyces sp. NPDC006872 TaxID=3155720 RepID=UPI0033F99F94